MTASFSQSDLIAYKSNLLQSLEELKYKRTECQDVNKRLEKLLSEKLQAQQSLEDLQTKLKNSEQKRDCLHEELRLVSLTVADSKHKDENQQLKEAVGTAEKTVASLKKELSSMSLARHQLETRLKQAEQKVAARETSSTAVIERLRGIEAATEKLSKQLHESYEAQNLLERNVEASKAINRELTQAWTHRNCLLSECRQQRDELREKLLDQECRYHAQEVSGESDQERVLKAKNEILEQKISAFDQQNDARTKLVEDLQARLKEAQITITKAHKIVEKCNADDKDVIDLEKRLEKSEKTCEDWERKHDEVAAKLEMQEIENGKKITEITSVLAEKESTMSKEIKLLTLRLEEAQKRGTDLKLQVEKFKEVKLNLHELQARFDSLVNEKRSLLMEVSRKDDQNEELRNKIDNVEIKLEDLKGRKPPECTEKESQTGIKVVSEQADGKSPAKLFQSRKAFSYSEPHQIFLQEGSKMVTDQPLEQRERSRGADAEECVEGTPDEDDAKKVEDDNNVNMQYVAPALTSPQPSARGESDVLSSGHFGSSPGRNLVKPCKGKSFEIPYMKKNDSLEQEMPILLPRDSQMNDPQEYEVEESMYENKKKDSRRSEAAHQNKDGASLILHNMTDFPAPKAGKSPNGRANASSSQKFSPFVKNPEIMRGSPILGNNTRRSILLNPASPESPSGYRRNSIKKRKLSSTPPMLDASQCSVMEGPPSSDLIRKEVPLRVPKNFTKQVLSSKPHPKQQPNRYKPLAVTTGASTSSPAISLHSVNRPYTDLNFSKTFASLNDRLASKFGGKRQGRSPKTAETRGMHDTSRNMSFGFRASDKIFRASDEELLGSDDSM